MRRAQLERLAAAKAEVALFNHRRPRSSFTRSPAFVGCRNRPVVFVAGRSGSLPLTQIEAAVKDAYDPLAERIKGRFPGPSSPPSAA